MVYKCINNIHFKLFPPTCVFCGLAGHNELDVCESCLSELPFNHMACRQCSLPLMSDSESKICGNCQKNPPHYHHSYSLFLYEPPISNLIQAIKFHRKIQYAHLLGELMANEMLTRNIPLPELIIPVPLHPSRQRNRGFNQAIELARPIARRTGVPIASNVVKRIHHTPAQTKLKANQRKTNIRGAFSLKKPLPMTHIAIMDDVVTTGSTVNELAKTLAKAGVKQIDVWSIARADYSF